MLSSTDTEALAAELLAHSTHALRRFCGDASNGAPVEAAGHAAAAATGTLALALLRCERTRASDATRYARAFVKPIDFFFRMTIR